MSASAVMMSQSSTSNQLFTLKGDALAELSRLVKRVGDQQKELVLDISRQLSKHNEMMDRAIEKQERMESKIEMIEQALIKKGDAIGFERKREKIDQMKKMQRQVQLDHAEKNSQQNVEDDMEGFESCEEDEEGVMRLRQSEQKTSAQRNLIVEEEVKGELKNLEGPPTTGDFIKDFYLELPLISEGEELDYILKGKSAMDHLLEELPISGWTFYKQSKGCDMFLKKGGSAYSCFRVNTDFDFPTDVVFDHIKDIPKRMEWDEGYDSLKFIREFKMQTALLYVKVKAQWPLGARDVLLVFQGITHPQTGSIYLGSFTVEHPECPIDPTGKIVRINTISGHYMFQALDGGKRCRLHYITEFNFGGNVPKSLVQGGASDKFMGGMAKLKKILMKQHPDKYCKSSGK